jgi:hypothetical protein
LEGTLTMIELRMTGRFAFLAALTGALALAACSGSSNGDGGTTGDGGNHDGGVDASNSDGGSGDALVRDVGHPDAHAGLDAAPPPCNEGDEGCPCMPAANPMMMPQGDCAMGLQCVTWTGPMDNPQVSTCVRTCMRDGDCMTPNTLCRPLLGSQLACVASEVADGQICNRSKRNASPMAGCKPSASCIAGPITTTDATGKTVVIPDQGSCGVPCGATKPCAAPYTYCNPMILNSTVTPGICSLVQLKVGAVCGQEDITRFCDRSKDTMIAGAACIGTPDNAPNEGVCVELCDPTHHPDTCPTTATNPGKPSICKAVIPGMPTVGACSDECGRFPNTCTGMGVGNGAECTPPLIFAMGATVSAAFCVDVQSPVSMQWDTPASMTHPGCGPMGGAMQPGDPLHCPSGTFCAQQNNGGNVVDLGCARGCTTSTAVAAGMRGCQVGTATTCLNGLGPNFLPTDGVCSH